jgi:hypothetical protein
LVLGVGSSARDRSARQAALGFRARERGRVVHDGPQRHAAAPARSCQLNKLRDSHEPSRLRLTDGAVELNAFDDDGQVKQRARWRSHRNAAVATHLVRWKPGGLVKKYSGRARSMCPLQHDLDRRFVPRHKAPDRGGARVAHHRAATAGEHRGKQATAR